MATVATIAPSMANFTSDCREYSRDATVRSRAISDQGTLERILTTRVPSGGGEVVCVLVRSEGLYGGCDGVPAGIPGSPPRLFARAP